MKAVILAGGLGTRISEETTVKPKPMIEIGDMPILWHIMKTYSAHGINEFIVCCGYKGHVIKEFFADFVLRTSSVKIDLAKNQIDYLGQSSEPWSIVLADTGADTMTGGRIKRIQDHLDDEPFCLTYGDGVTDVNVTELIEFHRQQDSLVTLTAVQPPGRFGAISLSSEHSKIHHFQEKPDGDGAWINGGYFIVDPEALSYIDGDTTTWEQEPLRTIAQNGQLSAYRHSGFWHPMDTLRDKNALNELWRDNRAPWKIW